MNIAESITDFILEEFPFLNRDVFLRLVTKTLENPEYNPNTEILYMIKKYDEKYGPFVVIENGHITFSYDSEDYLFKGNLRECINFFNNWSQQ